MAPVLLYHGCVEERVIVLDFTVKLEYRGKVVDVCAFPAKLLDCADHDEVDLSTGRSVRNFARWLMEQESQE